MSSPKPLGSFPLRPATAFAIALAIVAGAEPLATADGDEGVACFGPETMDPSCQAEVGDYIVDTYCAGGICDSTPCPPGYDCAPLSSELPSWVRTIDDAIEYAKGHNEQYAVQDIDTYATYSDEDFTVSSTPIAPGGHSGIEIGAGLDVTPTDPEVSITAGAAWEPNIGIADPVHPDTALDCDYPLGDTTLACLSPQGIFPTSQSDGFAFDTQPRESEDYGSEVLDPVSLVDGEFVVRGTDLAFPGFGVPYRHSRVYRSRVDYDGPLGHGWDHSLNQRLIANDGGVVYSTGDARSMRFHPAGRRASSPPEDLAPLPFVQEQWYETEADPGLRLRVTRTLLRPTWTMTEPGGQVRTFNSIGLLTSIVDANGNGLTIEWAQYDKDPGAEEDLVWRTHKVTDSVGRQIDYQYDSHARLVRVVEPVSGLRATYTYDAHGDLRTATDSASRTETFDYSTGFDDTAATYVPELALRRGCELACAQTGSDTAAGGACDQAAEAGPALCTSGCEDQCNTNCFLGCFGACGDGCSEACSCESRCSQFADATCYEAWWNDDFWWTAYGCVPHKPYEDLPAAPGTCIYDCALWADNMAAWGFYGYGSAAWLSDVGYCAYGCIRPLTHPCWVSYQETWEAACLEDFYSLCTTGAVPWPGGRTGEDHCEEDPSCVADCALFGTPEVDACVPACNGACSAECESACGLCLTDQLDYVAGCEQGCVESCLEKGRDGSPPRYGHTRDLNHNIVRVIDGNGDVYLSNTYGEDLNKPSFDAVIAQTMGGATADIAYRDLEREQAESSEGTQGNAIVDTPIGENTQTDLSSFGGPRALDAGEICPTGACTFERASIPVDTFVPWGPALVVFDGQSPGLRYRVTTADGQTAPEGISVLLLRLEGGRAIVVPEPKKGGIRLVARYVNVVRETTTSALDHLIALRRLPSAELTLTDGNALVMPVDVVVDPYRGPPDFVLDADGETARFWQAPDGNYYYDTGGAWSSAGEITLVRENSGVIRAYPGRPSALLHVAEGGCARAFYAGLGWTGALGGSISESCSESLTVSPLASLVTDSGLLASYHAALTESDASAQSVLDESDLFVATPLTPKRLAVTWRIGVPPGYVVPITDATEYPSDGGTGTTSGTIDTYIGWPAAGNGAAPYSHYRGATSAVALANLWERPALDFDTTDRPLYAFHWPRVDDGSALVWYDRVAVDLPAQFDSKRSAASCSDRTPAEPSVATRSTVVRDVYGQVRVYHWDRRGRLLQKQHYATASKTRFDYDARGSLVGIRAPLGHRSCMVHDAEGNLLLEVRHGQPDAEEPLPPIVQRYEYTESGPRRLRYVFDPDDPARVLAEYRWDDNGNLTAAIDALGNATIVTPSPWGIAEQEKDSSGVVTRYVIDGDVGVVESIVRDAAGPEPEVTTVDHDNAGRPTVATSPLGLRTIWDWDVTGSQRLRSVRYVDGEGLERFTVYGYDSDGQVTSMTDGRSHTTIEYDVTGSPRCERIVSLDGSAPEIKRGTHHGPDGRLLAVVEPRGLQYQMLYDGEGRQTSTRIGRTYSDPCTAPMPPLVGPTAEQLALSPLWRVSYDIAGRVTEYFDGRGKNTELRYDAHGREREIRGGVDATGLPSVVYRTGFDARGQLVWSDVYDGASAGSMAGPWLGESGSAVPSGLLAASHFQRDAAGRVVVRKDRHFSVTGALLGVDGNGVTESSVVYDDTARRITMIQPLGGGETPVTIERSFDGLGRVTNVTMPDGDGVVVAYSDGGRTVQTTADAPTLSGVISSLTRLTAWGAVEQVSTSDTGTSRTLVTVDFDARGLPTSRIGASGAATVTEYDALDRPLHVYNWYSDAPDADEISSLVWDAEGNLARVTSDVERDGLRHVSSTDYVYDALGRLEQVIRPEGVVEQVSYLDNTRLIGLTIDARGIYQFRSYDDLGHLTGEMATASLGGVTAHREYDIDPLGRLRSARAVGTLADGSGEHTTHIAWDSLGTPIGEWNTALGESLGVAHTPDALGRPVGSRIGGLHVERRFDGLDRLLELNIDGSPAVTFGYRGLSGPVSRGYASGVETTFEYDPLARLRGIEESGASGLIARWDYQIGLDGIPRAATLTRPSRAESSVFSVDQAGRLLGENHGVASTALLAPDASWSEANAAVGSELTLGSRWRSYALDGRSNWRERDGGDPGLFVRPAADDLDAYIDFGSSATYDDAGALIEYGDETYEYDLFGQLRWAGRGDGGSLYDYDALGRVVREENIATGEVTVYGYDGLSRTVRKRGDALDVTLDDGLDKHLVTVTSTGDRQYYHTDRIGSVYMVSDDAGQPLEWYDYTAYGDMTIRAPDDTVRAESGIGNRFGFQGHPFDTTTGLVEMRARFYKPEWGRFLNPDPIGLAGGPNLYAFVSSAPTGFTDPLGLTPKDAGGEDWYVKDGVVFHGSSGMGVVRGAPPGHTLEVPSTYDRTKLKAYREGVLKGEIGRNAGPGNSTSTRRYSAEQRAARAEFQRLNPKPQTTAPGGKGWAIDHTIELQHDLTGRKGTKPSDYRWQDSVLNSEEGRISWSTNQRVPQGARAGGVAPGIEAVRWYNAPATRAIARGFGRGLIFYGWYQTGDRIVSQFIEDLRTGDYWKTVRVVTEEAGGWGGAYAGGVIGAKIGTGCGPAAWICSPVLGLGGGVIGYFSGSSLVSWIWDWW